MRGRDLGKAFQTFLLTPQSQATTKRRNNIDPSFLASVSVWQRLSRVAKNEPGCFSAIPPVGPEPGYSRASAGWQHLDNT